MYDEPEHGDALSQFNDHHRALGARLRKYLDASPDTLKELKRVEDMLSARARRHLSLAGLIEDWSGFVLQVERGYELGDYDYANDLDIRELIHQILATVPMIREQVLRIVAPWDERFKGATVVAYEPRGGISMGSGEDLAGEREGRRWWYWREPKRWPGFEEG
jgi:hypothetical protein